MTLKYRPKDNNMNYLIIQSLSADVSQTRRRKNEFSDQLPIYHRKRLEGTPVRSPRIGEGDGR